MAYRRTVHNFLALFGAQAVAMATGLVATAWMARALEPEAFGIVGFGSAMLSYFGIFVVFGTDRLMMREIARDPSCIRSVLPRVIGLRILLLIVGAIVFLLIVALIDQPSPVKTVMRIQTVGLIATALSLDFVYQALNRMQVIGLRQVLSSVLVVAATLLLIRSPDDLYLAALVPHAALALTAVWIAWRIQRDTNAISVVFDMAAFAGLLRRSAPMALTGVSVVVYLTADILMLGFLDTAHAVGLYVGAARIYAISGVVTGLLVSVFLPSLSALFGDAERMRAEYRVFASTLVFLGLPIVATLGCFSTPVINILLGEAFAEASTTLSILMGASAIAIFNQIGCAALLSWNGERRQMWVQGFGAVLNVALNFVLIPVFGIVGAASASVASELVVGILLISACAARFGVTPLHPALGLGACIVAAFGGVIAMSEMSGSLLVFVSPVATLAVKGGLAVLIYAGLAWVSGLIDPRGIWAAARRSEA